MSTPSGPLPGWYGDPAGRFEVRWWDGIQWGDAVATAGQQHSDPLVAPVAEPAAEPVAEPVATALPTAEPAIEQGGDALVIDTQLTVSFNRNRRLRATLRQLEWGTTIIPYTDVVAVAYTATHQSMNLVPTATIYAFHLHGSRDKVKVQFQAPSIAGASTKASRAELFDALVALSSRVIEPPICDRVLQQVLAGYMIECGGVQLSRAGVHRLSKVRTDRVIPWPAVEGAQLVTGEAVVLERDPADPIKARAAIRIPLKTPNAVLLPRLLPEIRAALM